MSIQVASLQFLRHNERHFYMKSKLLSSIIVFLSISCAKDISPSKDALPTTSSNILIKKIKPKGTEKYLTTSSDYIYDQEKIRTYNLIIPFGNLYKLDIDPAKEEYVEAALVFEGDTISPIGVRYKGQIGSYAGCVSGPNWLVPSGYKTCSKLSMQMKINWEGRTEKFFDLNKLQFHAQNSDKSQLNERVGYWLFQEMGVAAPRSVHARLLINGLYSGFYGLTEEIDNRFAEYFYKNGKGNVYKEVWPIQQNGNAQTDKAFVDALRTNETTPDIGFIKEFAQAVANSKNPKETISKYMDVKSIIAYAVVDRVIRHDDGPFHWYCDFNDACFNKNYYWFEDKKNKKMHLIPWDLSGAFEHIIRNANPITPIIDKWGETSNNCKPYANGNTYFKQWSASCDKLTASWVQFDKEYAELKKHFQNNILSDQKTIAQIDIWAKQIGPYIKEADDYQKNGFGSKSNVNPPTYFEWDNAVNTLKNQIKVGRSLN